MAESHDPKCFRKPPCCPDESPPLVPSSDASCECQEYQLQESPPQVRQPQVRQRQARPSPKLPVRQRQQLHCQQLHQEPQLHPLPRHWKLHYACFHNSGTEQLPAPNHSMRRTRRRLLPSSEPFLVVASDSSPIALRRSQRTYCDHFAATNLRVVSALLGILSSDQQAKNQGVQAIPKHPLSNKPFERIIPKISPPNLQLPKLP